MKRIETIPLPKLWEMNGRMYIRIDAVMGSMGWDANRYGWDWPTAWVLHPNLVRMYRRSKDELRRRWKLTGLSAQEFVTRYITGEVANG